MHTSKIVITTASRLAPYLKQEVEQLGFVTEESWQTGVSFQGSLDDCVKLNLQLRTAYNVLWLVKEFRATDAEHLYHQVVTIAWETYIDEQGYLCVTSNVTNPTVNTSLFANVRCKDAIVDRIRDKKGSRPDSGSSKEKTVVHLHWKDEEAAIYLDTSGETLARHGYRKIPGTAPMQESLAAAVVMASGWTGEGNFVNPMCGSGTLAIEAALIALNKAPGLLRNNYGFMHVKGYNEQLYNSLKNDLQQQVKNSFNGKIIASDISRKAVEGARQNAAFAGVEKFIRFELCDFAETQVPTGNGVVIFNPGYGERLSEEEKLIPEYRRIGDFLKQKCRGYSGCVFTGNPLLAKEVGLKASRRIEFYNGKLDCRLLKYDLYEGSRRTKPL